MTNIPSPSRRALIAGAAALTLVAPHAAFAQDALVAKGYAIGDQPEGAEDAPVTIIEYASLTCPHCAAFHVQTYGSLKTDFIETGKVRFVLREIYFDRFGVWGAMLARCGGEANYHRIMDMLLTRQSEWYGDHVRAYNQTKNAKPIVDELFKIGRLAGMSNDRMTACLEDEALLNRLVEDFQAYSAEDDIRSTPTFLVNGEKVTGTQSPESMAALINKHL